MKAKPMQWRYALCSPEARRLVDAMPVQEVRLNPVKRQARLLPFHQLLVGDAVFIQCLEPYQNVHEWRYNLAKIKLAIKYYNTHNGLTFATVDHYDVFEVVRVY